MLVLKTISPHGEAEDRADIPLSHAHALLDVCDGEVDYTRTLLPIGEGHGLVEEILRPRILHRVTMELASDGEARAFHPLEWVASEVTTDPRYIDQSIALRGLDEVTEIPVRCGAQQPDRCLRRSVLHSRSDGHHRPKANQALGTRSKAQTTDDTVKVNPDELEAAMMREMEKTLPKDKPE
ncbi:hypothetical protein [Microvirga soli]|uniref:hypothetical protein n=1 Tax=Microvirga soli TaxID=1854496 RepID=UPI001FE99CD5|nr:hypothetical protein [Microvirga soli]